MKIALLGYGKMGKLVESEALSQGHQIVARIGRSEANGALELADIGIDFSHADCVVEHAEAAARLGKNLVIGTTGWEDQLQAIKDLAAHYAVGILYAPNFSIGAYLFQKVVEEAAKLMNFFPFYDAAGYEMHHRHKVDAPSGTAKLLAQILTKNLGLPAPLVFSSMRCGEMPGTHSVIFDSAADTLTLTHQARNRAGFASGALEAAKWLHEKEGFYTIDQMINCISLGEKGYV